MHIRTLAVVVAVSSALGARLAGFQPAQAVTADVLLQRAGEYVTRFEKLFPGMVAEELYTQLMPAQSSIQWGAPPPRRVLKSDFLLVKVPSEESWLPFRDVFEVDGHPVRDRQERLTRLFLEPASTAIEQVNRIVAEGARYNIGGVTRNINIPVLALAVLKPANQARFQFSRLEADRRAGPTIWSMTFKETARPTLIRGSEEGTVTVHPYTGAIHGVTAPGEASAPASGRIWIDAATGAVVKTELVVDDGDLHATIATDYRVDSVSGLHVPAEMRERYVQPRYPTITGTATYSNLRRFDVKVVETIKQ